MPLVSKSFSDIITFTRASSGTYFDATGTLQTATTNAARFDYNPSTLAARGMLVEEQRTNSIRNNTMVGAVAGTPGTAPTNWVISAIGLSSTIVGTGTENGINYVDVRVFGTTTSQFGGIFFETVTGIAASPSQSWTKSVYLKLISGTVSGLSQVGLSKYYYNSTSSFLNSSSVSVTLTSTLTRYTLTATTPATTAYIRPLFYFNGANASGDAVDFTLRIGLPQLELGAFATSVISTTTAAATRSADVASVNTLSPWYNAAAGTLYAEAQIAEGVVTTPATFASLDDTTASNRIQLRRASPGNLANLRMVSSAGSVDVTLLSGTLTGINKTAAAFTALDQNAANNGTLFTGISSIASLPNVTRLFLGDGAGSVPLNGWLRRITYYPRRLSNVELQGITT